MAISNGENVTTKDIVLGLDAKVDTLIVGLAELKGSVVPTLIQVADHEKRLRDIERFKAAVPSTAVLATVATVVSIAVAVFH